MSISLPSMGDISVPSLDPNPSTTPHSTTVFPSTSPKIPCFVEHDPAHKITLDLSKFVTPAEIQRELVSWFPDLEQTLRGLVYLARSDDEDDPETRGRPVPARHGELLELVTAGEVSSLCALTDRKFIEVELEDDEEGADMAVLSMVKGKGWAELREKIEECFEEYLEKRPIEELFWRNKEGIIYPAPESLSIQVLYEHADMIIVRQVKKG